MEVGDMKQKQTRLGVRYLNCAEHFIILFYIICSNMLTIGSFMFWQLVGKWEMILFTRGLLITTMHLQIYIIQMNKPWGICCDTLIDRGGGSDIITVVLNLSVVRMNQKTVLLCFDKHMRTDRFNYVLGIIGQSYQIRYFAFRLI